MAHRKIRIALAVFLLLGGLAAVLLWLGRQDVKLRLLVATNGDQRDEAMLQHFRQSLVAGLETDTRSLDKLTSSQLAKQDILILDPSLHGSGMLAEAIPGLRRYVEQGGHLFVEHALLQDLPLDLLGAASLQDIPGTEQAGTMTGAISKAVIDYPQTSPNLSGMQLVAKQFLSDLQQFEKQSNEGLMPGFHWGLGLVPAAGTESLVNVDGVAVMTRHRLGEGSVLTGSALLPGRYFITGFDMTSGMDPGQGFANLQAEKNEKKPKPGTAYFDRYSVPVEPYFNFSASSAAWQYRNEIAAYAAKENYGYAVKKVLGPNGRPAMAYQNHFEATPAIVHGEGIAWAELLKQYNQLPSFTLVRATYDWGKWHESLSLHLNQGSAANPVFAGERTDSYYSSGQRMQAEGKALVLAQFPGDRSLSQQIEQPYRAYPAVADLNRDGAPDLLLGSGDGHLYTALNDTLFSSRSKSDPLTDAFAAPAELKDKNGNPLLAGAGGFTTVAVTDLNGDGKPDFILGGAGGELLFSHQQAPLVFSAPAPLLAADTGQPLRAASYAAPAIGDVDGDGVPDLVVGDKDGRVTLFPGIRPAVGASHAAGFSAARSKELVQIPAAYAAPSVHDMNGDGKPDLVIGNEEGDLLIYIQQGDGTWTAQGPLQGQTLNAAGNHALVGGHFSAPLWYDWNQDGIDDLLVGQLEFGPPVPVNDPAFAYRKQLDDFIAYTKKNNLELYPHLYFHHFVSDEQEKQEIELHKQAFEQLGLPWGNAGTNQHTWRINNPGRLQTLRNERDSGLWFNFGFRPSYVATDPQLGWEYMWSSPFLMQDPSQSVDAAKEKPMLLMAPAIRLRQDPVFNTEHVYKSYAALDMPLTYFEHIEYQTPQKLLELKQFVTYLDDMRTKEEYNFMSEPQMARSMLAALTADIQPQRSWLHLAADSLRNLLGNGKHLTLSIRADRSHIPAQAAGYAQSLGIMIEAGEAYANQPLVTDSDIFVRKGSRLYAGLGQQASATVRIGWDREPLHLVRANVPVEISKTGSRWTMKLADGGMQQIKLYSPVPLSIEGPDLVISSAPAGNDRAPEALTYTVTHFGEPVTVNVHPAP
ncbi:FG-GAP repeat domain-containing protein [Paenibacillus sp. y28]|uniref:FG-GAP repeat domain-containing protein n=1 Tax=Paenibacillus sp. y28 TaxID=3129110 RepID=UPI0030187126